MSCDPTSGAVVFKCRCGAEEAGEPLDARVGGAVLGASETAAMYRALISSAAFDRTNTRVLRDCPACGLDYMVQVRVGDSESVVHVCKCGFESAV